jgi:hypothetical protein
LPNGRELNHAGNRDVNHPGASGTVTLLENGKVKAKLRTPQRAITRVSAKIRKI